jgi:hypothetical protein
MSNDEYALNTVMTFAPAFIPEPCLYYAILLNQAWFAI